MSLRDRQTLKNLFKNGSKPTQNSFSDIIDSSINKIDDGFSKSMEEGLMISPIGESPKALTIFKKITDQDPEWSVNLEEQATEEGTTTHLNFVQKDAETPHLNLSDNGSVGIKHPAPEFDLDVNGFAASKGRVGRAAKQSKVPADGSWHTIMDGLNHCTALEVVARVGIHKTGKHALLHAIAVSAYGNSHHRIKKCQARFSFWRPIRLQMRWVGTTFDYGLQIKSSKNLGEDVLIKYYVTKLWDDEEMADPSQFMSTED